MWEAQAAGRGVHTSAGAHISRRLPPTSSWGAKFCVSKRISSLSKGTVLLLARLGVMGLDALIQKMSGKGFGEVLEQQPAPRHPGPWSLPGHP